MKPFIHAGILTGSALLLLSAAASAQDPAPAAPAPAPAAKPAAPAAAPAATPAAEGEAAASGEASMSVGAATEADATAMAEPEPEPEPMPEPEPEPMPEPMPEPAAEEAADAETDKDPLSFSLFVDANYTFQSSPEGTPAPGHRAYAGSANTGPGGPGTLVNDTGFALSFAGIDAVYDQGTYGATVSLRFGQSVQNYHFNTTDGTAQGTIPLTQAYGTWTPIDLLSFDVGMFGTIFGAEVAESWQNLNYSRGGLYFGMQPFWHTGLRTTVTFSEKFALKFMLTNDANTGWNYDAPDQNAPVVSLQFAITPSEMFELYVGGMVAEDGVASGFETFGDLVAILSLGNFSAILNGDAVFNRTADVGFGGISLALGYQFVPMFGAAFRQELLFTPNGVLLGGQEITSTSTLTFDVKPIPDSSNVIIRLDGRVDWADANVFIDGDSPTGTMAPNTDVWLAAILGLVVTTDG